MKTTVTRQNALEVAMNRIINEYRTVSIYNTASVFDNKLCYGVNWSAIGTVPPHEAAKFAKAVERAANVCEFINSLDIEVEHGKKDYRITTHDLYESACGAYEVLIKNEDRKALSELLTIMVDQ